MKRCLNTKNRRAFLQLCTLVLAVLLMTGCERAAFLAANAPTHFGVYVLEKNIRYGDKPHQTLDVYMPPRINKDEKTRDVLVFFYGGRWTKGAKEDYRFIGQFFAEAGFITIIPDYAKYPFVRFPAFVDDGAKALAWVHDTAGAYGGNKNRIHVMGHSAGAHIGALVAADESYLAAHGKAVRDVIFDFVGLAGPYAFKPDEPDLIDMFPKPYRTMQVPTFIDGDEPPMLLMWGDADTDVGLFNLEKTEKRIIEKNGHVRRAIINGADHIDVLRAFTWLGADMTDVRDEVMRFLQQK